MRFLWLGLLLGLLAGIGFWEWHLARRHRYPSPRLAEPLLHRLARSVTVKVIVGQNWGSGVLVARRGQTYTLVTNQHVLEGDSRVTAFQIRTPDGRLYPAQSYPAKPHPVQPLAQSLSQSYPAQPPQLTRKDVAALKFTSDRDYPVVCSQPQLPSVGEAVFAAGFPFPTEGHPNPGFVFTRGEVSLILPQALEGGYRLGYTNSVEKGMSGGPVLNGYGRLVALNGMHQHPLWGDPYRYASGDKPAPELRAQLADSSWGIPILQVWQSLGLTAPPCPLSLPLEGKF